LNVRNKVECRENVLLVVEQPPEYTTTCMSLHADLTLNYDACTTNGKSLYKMST